MKKLALSAALVGTAGLSTHAAAIDIALSTAYAGMFNVSAASPTMLYAAEVATGNSLTLSAPEFAIDVYVDTPSAPFVSYNFATNNAAIKAKFANATPVSLAAAAEETQVIAAAAATGAYHLIVCAKGTTIPQAVINVYKTT